MSECFQFQMQFDIKFSVKFSIQLYFFITLVEPRFAIATETNCDGFHHEIKH